MLEIFFCSVIIITLFTPFGFFLSDTNNKNTYYFSKELLFGLIILSFLSILINFFFSLSILINSLILIIPSIIIIIKRDYYINIKFIKFILISSLLTTILILESNVYRPDSGLYHLPFIGILNSEKIIIGLSNIHLRYGHTSIMQYISAISNNIFLKNNGIVYPQALLATSIIINFISQIYFYIRNQKLNFHFFFLLFILIYIFYKMNRYSEYGNDAPAHFLVFFLISEILSKLKNVNSSNILDHLIISLFIIMNKLTLILIVLINLVNFKSIRFNEFIKNKKFLFLSFFFSVWLVKNILISGCFLFPVKFTCFQNLSWTDIKLIEKTL